MSRLIVFNQVTVDGYFTDAQGDIGWAHKTNADPEWQAFVGENATGGGMLLFGRKTYEMMASHWPTAAAKKQDPKVAEAMNRLSKVVFSRTLDRVTWSNTKLVKDDLEATVRQLKREAENDIAILGSGSLVAQLTRACLIDEYQVVVNPTVLGRGRTMFEGLQEKLDLKLKRTRSFGNGNVVLFYELAK